MACYGGAEGAAGDQPRAAPWVSPAIYSQARPVRARGTRVAQSLVKSLVHLGFSTRNPEPSLAETIRAPLCAYAAAVLRELDSPVLASDAWRDHVHVLFSLSKNHPLVDVVMQVKRATSKWLKTTSSEFTRFHWQAGYGAVSIGQSALEDTIA